MPIEVKINCSKITKSKLHKDKNGDFWLTMSVVPFTKNAGQDYLVFEKQTKEESDRRDKGNILGNGKNYGASATPGGGQPQGGQQSAFQNSSSEDLPF